MSATEPTSALGPATEALFAAAFARAATITLAEAAALIGVDVKTLRAMTDAAIVRAVPRGRGRAYTEAELRRYLLEAAAPKREPKGGDQCRSTSRKRATSGSQRPSAKILDFTRPPPSRGHDRRTTR